MSQVSDMVSKLPEMFNAARAKGYNRQMQLSLTGTDAGIWWVEIKDQKCTIHDGKLENGRLSLEMDSKDFLDYFNGQVHPMDLVRGKKMKFTGPMTESIAFNAIWNIPVVPQ